MSPAMSDAAYIPAALTPVPSPAVGAEPVALAAAAAPAVAVSETDAPAVTMTCNPPPAYLRDLLLTCDAVAFDVDSTVIAEEGIDVLAAHMGLGAVVAALTSKAMNGAVLFEHALSSRLSLLKPSLQSIQACLAEHPLTTTPHLMELMDTLRQHGKRIYLVTGGFKQMLEQLIARLNIDNDKVFANVLQFDEDGNYTGYDTSQPTSHSGGKGEAIKAIIERDGVNRIVMIGDGVTDMEACPPAIAFVGYGGVTVRERVAKQAHWFIRDWREIIDLFTKKEHKKVIKVRREKKSDYIDDNVNVEYMDEYLLLTEAAFGDSGDDHDAVHKEDEWTPSKKSKRRITVQHDDDTATKKPRKQRSDKGKSRGKYKQKRAPPASAEAIEAEKATKAIDDILQSFAQASSPVIDTTSTTASPVAVPAAGGDNVHVSSPSDTAAHAHLYQQPPHQGNSSFAAAVASQHGQDSELVSIDSVLGRSNPPSFPFARLTNTAPLAHHPHSHVHASHQRQ